MMNTHIIDAFDDLDSEHCACKTYLVVHEDGQAILYNTLPDSIMERIDEDYSYVGSLFDVTDPTNVQEYEFGQWNTVIHTDEIILN